jgi:2-keto-4-pentenoate hydratase
MIEDTALALAIAESIRSRSALPAFSRERTLEEAYALQRLVVAELCPNGSAGIKAGVTAPAMQERLGVVKPLLGELYPEGGLESGTTFQAETGVSLECEIGVMVDAGGRPKSFAPAIEVVQIRFADPGDFSAVNLVSGNVACDRFIQGALQPWTGDFKDAPIRLTHNGELINEASAMDSFGGPAAAVPWIVEEAGRLGIPIREDAFIMTGSCGRVVPAEPGHYVADYGRLGAIEFTVT